MKNDDTIKDIVDGISGAVGSERVHIYDGPDRGSVDDSTITASVKAKLVGEKTANLTRIEVDTTHQVVTLNGIVESADQKAKAEQLARQVGGVKSVKNNLQVQKQS